MKSTNRLIGRSIYTGLAITWLVMAASRSPLLAQDVTVNSANPNNAPQGTVNLNVTIGGKGFKKGAASKFFITGTSNPGGIRVNSTTFVTSTTLVANVDIASDAVVTKFDIVVALSDGRTGKGTQLFTVTIPDPAIAFQVEHNFNNVDLWVMDADGKNQTLVVPGSQGSNYIENRTPSWSPDGTQLAFASNVQGRGIYVVNKDGTGLRKVVSLNRDNLGAGVAWTPTPAADGQWKIAYSDLRPGDCGNSLADNDLFLVNLDGTRVVNLTNTVGPGEFHPTWDPYTTRLAAKVFPTNNASIPGDLVIYALGLDASGNITVTGTTNLTESGPLKDADVTLGSWAKTQDKIAMQLYEPGAGYQDIWVFNVADPLNPVNLTSTATISERRPSWSPDDSKIVFLRATSKPRVPTGIYVMNPDGSGLARISESGSSPDWRRCCPSCAVACAP